MITQSLCGPWKMRALQDNNWFPATVPGGTYTDLFAVGQIPDPFLSENELQVQWVANRDWEYCREFAIQPGLLEEERVELVCLALDTLAEITLNGHLIGQTDNMFRSYRWDVKEWLIQGSNTLRIVFRSPVAYINARQHVRKLPSIMNGGMAHLRKVQSHFGWDWGPRLATSGIWRAIQLEGHSGARLGDIHLRQIHEDGEVMLTATVSLEHSTAENLVLHLSLTDPDRKQQQVSVKVTDTDTPVQLSMLIDSPQLWWPNGLGDQPIYHVEVELAANNTTLDCRDFQVGLRTLELRQEPDQWGRTFTFVVNGVPLFAKGANWIPADSFPTRLAPERYERWIKAAAAANMNMLRVWGGGYYEDEIFYDLCDRYGILIWQDFMFACAPYPLDESAFLENVRLETEEAIRRLRHRACLALWSGNNELEMMWGMWKRHKALTEAYKQFFHDQLPAWVAELDPDHPYWPSSPSSGKFMEKTNSDAYGDTHLWQVWHGLKPFSYFRKRFTRFASEFGLEALPNMETIKEFAGDEEIGMESKVMLHHQRSDGGNSKIMYYLADRFNTPTNFADLVYLTQILQAECIRTGVEHWRRNRPRCSGALYWQLNDCWPVTSWAGIDYAGRWKALHYTARRFYAPVSLSIEDKGSQMSVFVANDYPENWQGTLNWSLETLDGEKVQTGSEAVTAQPLSATCIRTIDFASELKRYGATRLVFVAELYAAKQRLTWQMAFFAPEKKIAFENPALNWNVDIDGRELVITLTSQKLARFIVLELKSADPIFSDNFFDLPAGWNTVVRCPLPSDWTLEQAKAALRIHSLADVHYAGSTAMDRLERLVLALDPVSLFSRALYSFIE